MKPNGIFHVARIGQWKMLIVWHQPTDDRLMGEEEESGRGGWRRVEGHIWPTQRKNIETGFFYCCHCLIPFRWISSSVPCLSSLRWGIFQDSLETFSQVPFSGIFPGFSRNQLGFIIFLFFWVFWDFGDTFQTPPSSILRICQGFFLKKKSIKCFQYYFWNLWPLYWIFGIFFFFWVLLLKSGKWWRISQTIR